MGNPGRWGGVVIVAVVLGWTAAGGAQARARPAGPARQLFRLINQARRSPRYRAETAGEAAPLRWDAALAQVAVRHSRQMARAGALSHSDATASTPAGRVTGAGIGWTMVGENVAMAPTARDAQAMMMAEPAFQANHRGNILNRRFDAVGIGVVRAGVELYITEDFIRAAKP